MSNRTVNWILILCILLAGCRSGSDSAEPATLTPNVVPRLDPSPTPSQGTLPLACQVTDLGVYVDKEAGYCFAYPPYFVPGDQPFDTPNLHGRPVDDGPDPVYAMFVVEFASSSGRSLRKQAEEFLNEFSTVDPVSLSWTQVQVAGEEGLMVEPVPVMLSWRIVFVEHDGRLFRLMYWPVDVPEAQADLNDLTQTTLGSFQFIR